ncbi:hypothetical protein PFZ55_30365 [Streptomyces sp. MS2A]|nr:hypothetical protein [Streptomyces sp. MS2A]
MNDPQIWVLIGVFTAAILGGMTLVSTHVSRVIHAEINGLRGEMNGRFGEMNGRFEAVNARFDAVERRLDRVETALEDLDDEVTRLAKRVWDAPD